MPAVATMPPYTLVLREDIDAESPRETCDNLGTMVCFHSKYRIGDKHNYSSPDDFLRTLIQETVSAKDICDFTISEKAKTVELKFNGPTKEWDVIALYYKNWEVVRSFDHPIAGEEEAVSEVILEYMDTPSLLRLAQMQNIILPLYLYDHSVLSMSTASYFGRAPHAEWDSMQVGWIYVSNEDAAAAFQTSECDTQSKVSDALEAEVSEYDSYLRGECYGFQLYENGIETDSCWGFIGSPEELKSAIESNLPGECSGIMDNLTYLSTEQEVDNFILEQSHINMEGDFSMSTSGTNFEAKAYPFEEAKGSQIGQASITMKLSENSEFTVTNIKIIQGQNGPFAAMPSAKDGKGGFRDVCFPTTKEGRAEINTAVMDAFNRAIEKRLENFKAMAGQIAGAASKEAERPSATGKLEAAKSQVATATAIDSKVPPAKGDEAR